MATDEDAEPGLDIDLIAASLRADASDLGAFVEALATKLEEAVPGSVVVERRREGFGAQASAPDRPRRRRSAAWN